MNLLAIETATEACSVALAIDGAVRERFELAPRRHAELALPWIDALLAEGGIARGAIDAIAVGRGPGAFTGVRLAVALAQGLALGLDRPLLPVSSLAALALGARAQPGQRVLAAIDARMGEVYVGAYRIGDDGLPEPLADEVLCMPAQPVLAEGGDLIGIGTGFAAVDGALVSALGVRLRSAQPDAWPHAADVARLGLAAWARGEAVAPESVEPAYLRDKVAETIAERAQRVADA